MGQARDRRHPRRHRPWPRSSRSWLFCAPSHRAPGVRGGWAGGMKRSRSEPPRSARSPPPCRRHSAAARDCRRRLAGAAPRNDGGGRHAGTAARTGPDQRRGGGRGQRWPDVIPRDPRGESCRQSGSRSASRSIASAASSGSTGAPTRSAPGGGAHRNRRRCALRRPATRAPLELVIAADPLFPFNRGTHLVGPSLKLAWLSFGPRRQPDRSRPRG